MRGGCCDRCPSDLELAADPALRKLAARGVHVAAIGDILPKIVSPDDVAKLKRDLDPQMRTTDEAVRACPELDPPTTIAWGLFFSTWQAYVRDENPLFGSSNRFDEGMLFQGSLSKWQEILRAKCKIPGPPVVDPKAETENQFALVKWAVVGVVAVAVVVAVKSVF